MTNRFENWCVAWASMFTGLAGILTLGFYWPAWEFNVIAWSQKRKIRRKQNGQS